MNGNNVNVTRNRREKSGKHTHTHSHTGTWYMVLWNYARIIMITLLLLKIFNTILDKYYLTLSSVVLISKDFSQ